jgi:hypothetical protein
MINYVHISDQLTETNSVSFAKKIKKKHVIGLYFSILDSNWDLRFCGLSISPSSEIKQGVCLFRDSKKIYNRVEISFGKLQRIWWAWDQLTRAEYEEEVHGALSQGFHKTQSTGRNRKVYQYFHLTEWHVTRMQSCNLFPSVLKSTGLMLFGLEPILFSPVPFKCSNIKVYRVTIVPVFMYWVWELIFFYYSNAPV